MAKVDNWPLNYSWASLTSNKLSFTQTEVSAGITYKGPIVSNQVNGISHLLSRILQFSQASNGYYHPTMVYHKGNFVSIVHSSSDHPMQVETYMCINDDNDKGISNRPPLLVATTNVVNGITQYNEGVINSQYWKRIDVGESRKITPISLKNVTRASASDTNNFCALLMSVPDISFDKNSSKPERTKTIEADLSLTCKCGDNWSTVDFRIRGKYLRDDDSGSYIKPNDYFNMPVPDIYIDNVSLYAKNNESYTSTSYTPSTVPQNTDRGNIQSSNQSPSKDQLMNGQVTPYGFNFVIGYTSDVSGKRNWGIYIVSKESTEFELEGSSTIPVTLSQISDTTLTVMNVIPVRPNGGANSYGQLLELVEYDETSANFQNPLLFFSRGQVELRNSLTVNNDKFSCYKILGRMQTLSVGQLKEHTGRHTRAYGGAAWATDGRIYAGSKPGELLEPGLPNVWASNNWCYYGHEGQRLWASHAAKLRQPDGNASYWYNNYGYNWEHRANDGTNGSGGGNMGYTSGGYARVYWFLDAHLGNPIYKRAKFTTSNPVSIWDNSGGIPAAYNDVTTKSISVSRYIKIF